MDAAIAIYTNHAAETTRRRFRPIRVWFGSTAWHPYPQWLLEVWDLDKQATRDYALSGLCPSWQPLPTPKETTR